MTMLNEQLAIVADNSIRNRVPDQESHLTFADLPPVIHLSVREGLSSVFLSQVAKPMRVLSEQGLDVQLAMICALGEFVRSSSRAAWLARGKDLDTLGLPWARLSSSPSRLSRWAPDQALFQAWLKRRIGLGKPLILHCRGTAATRIALAVRQRFHNVKVVGDCRGVDGPEQALYRGIGSAPSAEDRKWTRDLEAAQRLALEQSDAIICVSQAMKSYLVESWDLNPTKVGVIPCCIVDRRAARGEPDVEAVRQKYGFAGKVVFAFSASDAPWQRTDDVVRLCSQLANRVPQAHFMFLTWKPDQIAEQFRTLGVDLSRTTILSLRHKDVAHHLAAADVGILLRDLSLVNKVASPVKAAEYLAAGLPIILTPSLGDYSDLIKNEGLGVVTTGADMDDRAIESIIAFAQQPLDALRAVQLKARTVASRDFSWSRYLNAFRQTYVTAMASPACRMASPSPNRAGKVQ